MTVALLVALAVGATGLLEAQQTELLQAIDLVRTRQIDAALTELERLCPLPPKDVSKAADGGNVACRVRVFAWSESNSPQNPKAISNVYWLAGDKAHKRGDLDIAEALLNVAVERDPDDAYNWYSIGMVYRDSQRPARAVQAFERSLDLKPDDPADEPYTLYWLATALIDLGELDQAEETLDAVLRADPGHARVWFRRGEIQMIRGDYEPAIQAFKSAKKRGVPKKDVQPKIRECEEHLRKQ